MPSADQAPQGPEELCHPHGTKDREGADGETETGTIADQTGLTATGWTETGGTAAMMTARRVKALIPGM